MVNKPIIWRVAYSRRDFVADGVSVCQPRLLLKQEVIDHTVRQTISQLNPHESNDPLRPWQSLAEIMWPHLTRNMSGEQLVV